MCQIPKNFFAKASKEAHHEKTRYALDESKVILTFR